MYHLMYELFNKTTDFEEAICILRRTFVQEKSEVYPTHVLIIRAQQAQETLDQYLPALHILVKDCNYKDITTQV